MPCRIYAEYETGVSPSRLDQAGFRASPNHDAKKVQSELVSGEFNETELNRVKNLIQNQAEQHPD